MFSSLTKKQGANQRSDEMSAERAMALMSQKQWPEAARIFRKLLVVAHDPAIWMQYGHALKETGFYEAAAEAYQKAGFGAGANQDFYLQLGHLYKIVGDFDRANASYIRARDFPDADAFLVFT